MTSTDLQVIAPLEALVPPPPSGEVLTESQWTTLLAIADTILPAVVPSPTSPPPPSKSVESETSTIADDLQRWTPQGVEGDTKKLVQNYLGESPSSVPAFKECVERILGERLRPDALKGFKVLLSTLEYVLGPHPLVCPATDRHSSRPGCLLTTGSTVSFHLQPANVREQILQGWSRSYLSPLRTAAKAFSGLVANVWLKTSPTINSVIGFPRAPVHGRPSRGYEYEFIQLPPDDEPEILETDVVIVGSGCGGGVCAKNLAESGLRVIVVESGFHWGPEYLPMTEKDAGSFLFANGGVASTDDGSMGIISADVWGGGGTVNWSASLQTQSFVRQEWADGGLPHFTSAAFQESLDRVCQRMGVSTKHIRHNPNNQILMEGARKLGYSYKEVPQNTGGNQHYCGYCTLGCGSAEKQGPVVSFLPDAARAGAKFVEGYRVEKVLFDTTDKGQKQATGIVGTWRSRDTLKGISRPSEQYHRSLQINAKRVILSAGTFSSPLILLRSGLTNPQIGRNMHLHPAALVTSVYGNSPQPLNPWEGGILTAVVDEFQNQDGRGHGVKVEAMTMLPSLVLSSQAWRSGLEFKELCAKTAYMACHVVIVRDRDTGRVYPDPGDGSPRIAYSPSTFDADNVVEGVIGAAKIAYINGATEINIANRGIPIFVKDELSSSSSALPDPNADESFQSWIHSVRTGKAFRNPTDARWGCAHQMGSCRMSASPRNGVVDPSGQVWQAEGLYVADASVFPSASGVNPMVTTMAIADGISRGIAKDMQGSGKAET